MYARLSLNKYNGEIYMANLVEAAKNQISALLAQQAANIALQETPDRLRLFGLEGNANARDMMLFYLSGFFALVLDWHSRGFDRSIDEVCGVLMELLTKTPIASVQK